MAHTILHQQRLPAIWKSCVSRKLSYVQPTVRENPDAHASSADTHKYTCISSDAPTAAATWGICHTAAPHNPAHLPKRLSLHQGKHPFPPFPSPSLSSWQCMNVINSMGDSRSASSSWSGRCHPQPPLETQQHNTSSTANPTAGQQYQISRAVHSPPGRPPPPGCCSWPSGC